jgi:AcrR family transcriptional regulator
MSDATARAPGRPSEGARDALLDAARDLFMERDYDRVSTAEILQRSGVSRGALYHHFPSKRDLFRAVYERSERRVIALLVANVEASATPVETLLAMARAYLHLCETDEELRRIGLTQSRAVMGWDGWRAAAADLGIGAVLAVVTAAIEADEFPDSDPETASMILLAALLEGAMLIVAGGDRAAARERSEKVIVDLLEGLRR